MLGKTPAGMALATVAAIFASTTESAAQSAASEMKASTAASQSSKFDQWRDRFRAKALKEGIPHDVFEKALGSVRPDPKVQEKDAAQPEFTRAIWDYLDGAVSDTRIRNGRKMMARYASKLAEAEKQFGIPRRYLVAIWGMETSYGALLGNHNIFEALATLGYDGDRQEYGEAQLLAALRLLTEGAKPAAAMKGSWAGAVGHTQFIPTTYLKYAVDGNHDGRRDLWESLDDVFQSTANYLKESGFDEDLKWGREVVLPSDFDYALAGYDVTKPLSEWRRLNVKMTNGALLPDLDIPATILVPAGHEGPAFVIYENFQSILAYNQSTSYALAIGLLSDQLQGRPPVQKPWPRHLRPLKRDERIEIQERLTALGYEPGKADGVLGRESRAAIRAFQKDQGEIADGFPTAALLTKLRTAKPRDRTAAASTENEAKLVARNDTTNEASRGEEPAVKDLAAAEAETEEEAEAEAEAEEEAEAEAEAETEPAVTAPVGTPLPRNKNLALGLPGQTDADKGPVTPPPSEDSDSARAEVNEIPKGTAPKLTGIPATFASPGLVIIKNGVARPIGKNETQPNDDENMEDSPASMSGESPVNNGREPIIAPPGTSYIGEDDNVEDAGGATEKATGESPEKTEPEPSGR